MSEAAELIKRFEAARTQWELWRSLHQEAFEYAAPNRETFKLYSPGQRKNRQIFDSTAVLGLQQFANRIQGALMPPWQKWGAFVAGDEVPEGDEEIVNQNLELVTDRFFSSLNHSNFYTELSPTLTDLGIGTGAILVEETPFGSAQELSFTNVPLAELYIEKPASGPVKNVWRKQSIRPWLIKQVWPEAELKGNLAKLAEKPESKEVEIINGFIEMPDGRFKQTVIYEAQKDILFEQTFNTQRLIVTRWTVTPGEGFGRGPIIQQLPDIKTANKIKEFMLQNAALQIAGVYTGVDDGIFNPHTARIAPGVILPVGSNSNANPSLQALSRSGDLGLGDALLTDIQEWIRKALFADPMGDLSDPVRSATEMMLRNQDMLRNSGAAFGRQKTEFIEPLAVAVIDILASRGKVPRISIDGKEVTIKLNSPLAKAENMEDFQNSQVWFQTVAQLPPEIVAASVKVEELPRYWQETLGIPADLIRTDAEIEQLSNTVSQAAESGIEAGL